MNDSYFMQLAIEEAKKGVGRTSPNPAVGAVIVKGSHVVGKGYHKKAGTPHAEINAINNTRERLDGATIYVTLEPCSHSGRTGPCCEAIAKTGISRVVVGMTDPNPIVNGRGINYLRQRGIDVDAGVLTKECEELNIPFIKYMTTSMPYMIMKAGVSLDGKLNYQKGVAGKITGSKAGFKVHQLRDTFDAILVGSGTVLADNPALTTRLQGRGHRDPVRIIIDKKLSTPVTAQVYNQDSEAKTIIMSSVNADPNRKLAFKDRRISVITVSETNGKIDLKEGLMKVAQMGISSVLVEGGSAIHGSFLKERLYDFAYLFYAPVFAGSSGQGLISSVDVSHHGVAPRLTEVKYELFGEDMMVSGKVVYPG